MSGARIALPGAGSSGRTVDAGVPDLDAVRIENRVRQRKGDPEERAPSRAFLQLDAARMALALGSLTLRATV